jgi:V8-like Glu-specific endopeptidase
MKVREGAKLALFVAACAACSSDISGTATSVDFEAIIDGTPASAYPEAVYLNIDMSEEGGYACTGALIAPRVVLTAGHCVDGHGVWEVYAGSAYRRSTDAAVYDWKEEGVELVNPKHHDVALVFLDDAVNLASYPVLSDAKVPDGTEVVNVGRVQNGAVLSSEYQAGATISAADRIGYPYDYTSAQVIEPGDSGGPVFLKGSHTLVAVNSGAGSEIQVLARVDLVYDWIEEQVAAHGGAPKSGKGDGSSGANGTADKSGAGGASGSSTGTAASGGASGSGAPSAAPAPSCSGSQEREPNDAFEHASALGASECGELASGSDVDFYAVSASAGSHTLSLDASSDATLSVGVASGKSCVVSLANVTSANVTVSGGKATLCVKASSPGKKKQRYALSFE